MPSARGGFRAAAIVRALVVVVVVVATARAGCGAPGVVYDGINVVTIDGTLNPSSLASAVELLVFSVNECTAMYNRGVYSSYLFNRRTSVCQLLPSDRDALDVIYDDNEVTKMMDYSSYTSQECPEEANAITEWSKNGQTCAEVVEDGGSGWYNITLSSTDELIGVYCYINDTEVYTTLNTNSTDSTKVNDYEDDGSYHRVVSYTVNKSAGWVTMTDAELISFVEQHPTGCQQRVIVKCRGVSLTQGSCWYEDVRGVSHSFCPDGDCECQTNDMTIHYDTLTYENATALPITDVFFGDTGGEYEYIVYTVSSLLCF